MQPPGAAYSSSGLAAPPGLGRRARSGTVAVRPSTRSSTPPLAPLASSSTPPFSQSSSGLPGMFNVEAQRDEQRHVEAERDGEQDGESEEEHDRDEVQAASPTIQRFVTASLSPERVVSRQRERPSSARWSVEGGGLKRTRKKWLVLIVPPSSLPHDPPPASVPGFAHGYGAPGRFEGGILMTLQPTLASQVSLIAREYGLPSVAGMCLYLALPPDSSSSTPATMQYGTHSWSPHLSGPQAVDVGLKPRLTDEFWPALWSAFFQDDDGVGQGMVGASGLPIVGRIEFDFDPRRARWLDEWRARPLTTRAESLDIVPPLSPALSLRLERPLHRTSSSYVRPVTPSLSDIYVSESHTTDDDGDPSSSPRDGLSAPTTPRTSTPRTSFDSHRPLSLVSQASARYQSQPRSASVTSAQSSSEDVKDGAEVEATTPRAAVLPAHLVKSVVNDSGFDEGTPSRVVECKPAASSPPEPSPITLTASGSTFAFPRPLPRSLWNISAASSSRESDALFTSAIPPDSDWTTQLDRLREISETSLVVGVDHPSHFGSVDTSANETLGEFLLSIVGEAAGEAPARARRQYEEDFASGIYPMRGLYGLAQPSTALPLASASSVVCAPVAEPASSTTQDDLAPASTRSASSYPFVVLYPPVYPTFNLYPPPAASSSYTSTIREPSPRTVPQPVAPILDDPSSWVNEPATPSGYVDDDPFASSSFSPDSPTSPAHGGSSDGLDDFLESYTHQGRPLSSITEVTENVTSGSTSRTWSGNFTPAVETPSAPGGRFGELELEEIEDAQWATEPVALPQILLDAAAGPPRFTYSSPTASIEPSTLEPLDLAHSPLPSPTIRPASALSATLPLIPPVPVQPHDDSDEELDATAHEDDDYTLDVTSTLSSTLDYSGSFDSPYLVSPGLQAALGLDDSPQLGPVLFGDEGEYEVHAAAGDSEEDSQSEDGSQYSGRRQSMRVDEDERDPGDQCLTLDRFTLSQFEPVLPVLFSFPSLSTSRELLDALAQFIVEAQVQSVDRRGSFRIALGGGALPELLSQALVLDERVEWDKWEIFFASDCTSSTAADAVPVTQRFVDELFSRVPVGSGKVHVFFPGGKGTDVAQEYEDQLARVFEPDEGEVPRFDLILLGAADLGITTSTAASTSSAHWVTSLDSSDTSTRPAVALSPSILSATRRLAYLLPSTSSRDALVSVLAHDAPGNVQLSSRQPVVLFADEDAAGAVEWERARFWDAEDE